LLTLTDAQCAALMASGAQNFVEQIANTFLADRSDRVSDPGRTAVIAQMRNAYDYAVGIGMTSAPHLVHFLYIAADGPRFYEQPAIDAWLKKPRQSPEQRFDDLVAVLSRKLENP
jgi:hypothetical protein